ncbi:hypothetical protein HMPREF9073_02208 [Capnocytophaga sp. oral taxon 326 str. F0382]|nr:hypothetical protein HMPREF9073_02208 [Capnocytophaga sp. oral taxon 326 str. F0382]
MYNAFIIILTYFVIYSYFVSFIGQAFKNLKLYFERQRYNKYF